MGDEGKGLPHELNGRSNPELISRDIVQNATIAPVGQGFDLIGAVRLGREIALDDPAPESLIKSGQRRDIRTYRSTNQCQHRKDENEHARQVNQG